MNQEFLDMIIKIVVAVVTVLITRYLVPWIKEKTDSTKYNNFLSMVLQCVEAANQLYTPEEWKAKKEYVLNLAIEYAGSHGVNVTMKEIDAIIEGFVIAVKGE